jgi:anti-anti-sigma regulatory factor
MKVKIDTKEKFNVISVEEEHFSANMTEKFSELLLSYLNQDIKNVIIRFTHVKEIDKESAEKIVELQQLFYDNNTSFVVCELQPQVEEFLDKNELLELINLTPTESEAWDIVQMELIERELLDDAPNPHVDD